MRACSFLRHGDHYRADVFAAALRRLGYQIETQWQRRPEPRDLLVVWNRTRAFDPIARIYEAAGARVLVVENGYLDRLGGLKYYAVALGGHNGSGRWFVGPEPRFAVAEQPWRREGRKVLVLPQRGIGQLGVAMPSTWPSAAVARLRQMTDREIVVRPHPGHIKGAAPIDFADTWCAVTWGSGAAIKALQAGIPVFHDYAQWIGASAAAPLADDLESCQTPDRHSLWTRLTWAQWTLDEIASGEALDRLLNEDDRGLFRAESQSGPDHREGDGGRHRAPGAQPQPAHRTRAPRPLPV